MARVVRLSGEPIDAEGALKFFQPREEEGMLALMMYFEDNEQLTMTAVTYKPEAVDVDAINAYLSKHYFLLADAPADPDAPAVDGV